MTWASGRGLKNIKNNFGQELAVACDAAHSGTSPIVSVAVQIGKVSEILPKYASGRLAAPPARGYRPQGVATAWDRVAIADTPGGMDIRASSGDPRCSCTGRGGTLLCSGRTPLCSHRPRPPRSRPPPAHDVIRRVVVWDDVKWCERRSGMHVGGMAGQKSKSLLIAGRAVHAWRSRMPPARGAVRSHCVWDNVARCERSARMRVGCAGS